MPERMVQALLARVEELAPEACGAFVVAIDGRRVGSVFVEQNRVCWAAAAGLGKRLRALLRERMVYNALQAHTIESLIALPEQQGEAIEWVTRDHSYRPRFTFSPVELLVAVNARLYANEAHEDGDLELDAPIASFVTGDDGAAVPVRLARHPAACVRIAELGELGTWAEAALGATRGFSRDVLHRAIALASGDVALAWRSSRTLIHAAVFEDRDALASAIAALEHRHYPAVLSGRIPRSSRLTVRDGLGSVVRNV